MEKKLSIKDISPYLPYRLKIETKDGHILILKGSSIDNVVTSQCKPLLKPLSDWHKIEDGTQFLSPYFHDLEDMNGGISENITSALYSDIQLLLVNHYDVFGLIPAGLAIDINTLTK